MYASLVSPVYEARNPASASCSGSLKTGPVTTRAAEVAVIGTSLKRAEIPDCWAYRDPSRYADNTTVTGPDNTRSDHSHRAPGPIRDRQPRPSAD